MSKFEKDLLKKVRNNSMKPRSNIRDLQKDDPEEDTGAGDGAPHGDLRCVTRKAHEGLGHPDRPTDIDSATC